MKGFKFFLFMFKLWLPTSPFHFLRSCASSVSCHRRMASICLFVMSFSCCILNSSSFAAHAAQMASFSSCVACMLESCKSLSLANSSSFRAYSCSPPCFTACNWRVISFAGLRFAFAMPHCPKRPFHWKTVFVSPLFVC